MWGNHLQSYDCSLQLVELILRPPKKLNIKRSSVGEPLANFRLLSSVAPPLLDCLMSKRLNFLERARWGKPLAKLWLFPSVSGNDTTLTKEIKYKNISVGEPLAKFLFLSLVVPPLLECIRRLRASNWIRLV